MKLCTDIHGPQRMCPNDFGDPLTLPLALPAGQSIYLSSEVCQNLLDGLAQKCCTDIFHR